MYQVELEGRALHIIYCDADKRPMGWGHGWGDAVADPASIARLRTGPLVGVATGKINEIVVVDIDPRHGGDKTLTEHLSWLPPTRTHRSRSGGQHLVYRYPLEGIRNFTGTDKNGLPGIELKSDGLGVVWPPSPGYSVIDDRRVEDCPDRLRDTLAIAKYKGASSPGNGDPSESAESLGNDPGNDAPLYSAPQPTLNLRIRTKRILDVVQTARAGDGRNAKLYWAARRFGELIAEGKVKRSVAEFMLLGVAHYNGHVAKRGLKQTEDTIASGLDHQVGLITGEAE
jgi:hypothetical protein